MVVRDYWKERLFSRLGSYPDALDKQFVLIITKPISQVDLLEDFKAPG